MNVLDWYGLYKKGWKDEIVAESFAHPAKFPRALIEYIYVHMAERGWLHTGDTVLDPFGGVALGAFPVLRKGINWLGIELEQPFVDMGNQNIELWYERYGQHYGERWGRAALLQGDSRNLLKIVQDADVLISSPPYAQTVERWGKERNECMKEKGLRARYGDETGQLATLPEGDINAIVSSPPYSEGCQHTGGADQKPEHVEGGDYHMVGMSIVSSPPYSDAVGSDNPDKRGGLFKDPKRRKDVSLTAEYGESDGQLAKMKEGDLAALVSSPPYADSEQSRDEDFVFQSTEVNPSPRPLSTRSYYPAETDTEGQLAKMDEGQVDAVVSSPPYEGTSPEAMSTRIDLEKFYETYRASGGGSSYEKFVASRLRHIDDYGETQGQMGKTAGDTFWSAARLIVEQCYILLPPGSISAWVVQDYCRDGQVVPFTDNWRELCEACGFKVVEMARVWKVSDQGTQKALFGEDKRHIKRYKSFFRTLYEQKGGPAIDYEVVWFLERG